MAEIKKYPQCCERCGEIFEAEVERHFCEECRKIIVGNTAIKRKIHNAVMHDLRCVRCGALFSGNYTTAKYCEHCREVVRRSYQEAYRRKTARPMPEREKEQTATGKRRARPKPTESIEECVRNARAAGLSYGIYVARKYYGGGVK